MFHICVAGRNHEAFTEQCLTSLLSQKGPIVVDWTDDASDTDEAFRIARGLLGADMLATLRKPIRGLISRRTTRIGGLANLWDAINRANDDDVCVLVGGDDWLEPTALERIAREYEDPNCWATHGSYINTSGSPTLSRPWDGADIRQHDFLWMPLTCRAWLAKKIFEEDLKIAGYWQWCGGDVALNLPIVEMAGPEHVRHIPDVWYTRRSHAQNDGVVDIDLQLFCNWYSYRRPKYNRLASREDVATRTAHELSYALLFSRGRPMPVLY